MAGRGGRGSASRTKQKSLPTGAGAPHRTRPVRCRRAHHRPWSSSTVTLLFADAGPWWDGDINVELFEAVLSYSRLRGPERLLLVTMAAVADEGVAVRDLSTHELCSAAGIADRTYRRARASLLATGQSSWSAASAAAGTRTYGR